jgi:hypothetical protein
MTRTRTRNASAIPMQPKLPQPDRPSAEAGRDPSVEQEMHLAYELVVQEVQARPSERLEPLNVNVGTLLLTVLGAVPKIAPHRATLAQLPTFDIAQFDDLQLYALALAEAHGLRQGAAEPPHDLTELARKQRKTREQLLVDARALAKRGFVDPKRVDKVGGGLSYLSIAFDVVGLVGLLLENWNLIQGKTGVTRQELEQARKTSNQLVAALGRKQQLDDDDDPNDRIYREIFSRLTRAYSDVRRALQFIRRNEGDANRIAPSAYPGRPKPSKKIATSS